MTIAQGAEAGGIYTSGANQAGQRQQLNDRELIEAACKGNATAFGCLVRKYQDRLCTSLLHICGSAHEAEEVAQEAFFQAHRKLQSFSGSSAFYTWLYRIGTNIAITRHRRRRKEFSLDHGRDVIGVEPHDDAEHPEEKLLREERAERIRLALDQLNDEHRKILVLREVEGCDYDTISKILELPVGTVRSRLHRARLQLRDKLVIVLGDSSGPASPLVLSNPSAPSTGWWSSN